MSLINHTEQYALYKSKQSELIGLIEGTSKIASKLNTEKLCNALDRLVDKVSNTSFKIQIAGTFKNGKSTFINALLGEEILPAYALPCTAVINEVKYGTEKKAKLYFKNPLPETLPTQMAERAAEHIRNHGTENIPPMDIPYDEIEDYVIIPIGKDPKEMLIESPYEKVELFWPLELLKNGIEIIDSPGLNEHATRTKVTVDYLSKADAILFVLSATSLCSKEEMSFIENTLMPHGFNELFFIVNRFDLIPEKEQSTIIKYANKKLRDFTKLTPDWLFFVSALNALESKSNDDTKELESSGFLDFEKYLSSFLTENKGKTKLVQPARELKRIVDDELLKNLIAQEREILSCSLAELKSRYETAAPQLALLNNRRADLSKKINLEIEKSEAEFRSTILQGLVSLQNAIPNWINEFTPTLKLGAVPNKEKVNLLVSEILEHITGQAEAHQSQWCKKMLVPLIERKSADIFKILSEEITDLLNDVTTARSTISPNTAELAPLTWQSVVKIDELSNISSAYTKTDSLSKELARVISYNASASLALQVFESTNPITLSASLMSNVFSALTGAESTSLKKIKSAIAAELSDSLTMNAQGRTNNTTNEILNRFKTVLSQVSATLDEEISHVQSHLKSLISEMERDDYDMTKKTNNLNECASELTLICNSVDKFIVGLDGENVLDEYIELAKEIVNDDHTDEIIKTELNEVLSNIKTDRNKKIHISIIGEFSTGKSTFINALTKTDLMSSQFLQGTTVTATRIENSDSLRLELFYNNGTTDSYEPETMDELKFKLSQAENIAEDLHSVKVSMPVKTLGEDVCIVDTPGINVESTWHEDVTVRAINELCDIPLVLIDATKALPESLVRFMHTYLSDRFSDCLFVVTKLDMVKSSERSTILKFVKAKLKQEFNIESPLILGYSSADVLDEHSKATPKNPELAAISRKNEKKIIAFARNHGIQSKTQADIEVINKLLDLISSNERTKLKTVKPIAEPKKSMFTVRQSLSSDIQPSAPKSPARGFKRAKLNN